MADELILLDLWYSTPAGRVRIALAEKGIEYDSREEDLSNKTPLLLKMNPVHKQIPVLIHNGKPVCESLIIVEYIDEVWNHKSPLLPSDPHHRAHARFWADYVDKKIYSNGRQLMLSTGVAQEVARNDLLGCFKVLEGELGDKRYFGGETFGIVDVTLIPYYSYFYTYEKCSNFSMVVECPKLVAWAHRCMEKKSVSKSLPNHQKVYDFYLEFKKKFEAKFMVFGAHLQIYIDKTPLLLKMNPVNKQILMLIHNGKPVCESVIIVEYMDEVWNHKTPLLPSVPVQRAHARFWADYVDKKVYSLGRLLFTSTGEALEVATNDLIGCFKLLEGELGDKLYIGGETFGIVDVAVIPFYTFFYLFEQFDNFSMVTKCSKIVAWANRCMEKESVSNTLLDQHKIYDFMLERKKKLEAK